MKYLYYAIEDLLASVECEHCASTGNEVTLIREDPNSSSSLIATMKCVVCDITLENVTIQKDIAKAWIQSRKANRRRISEEGGDDRSIITRSMQRRD